MKIRGYEPGDETDIAELFRLCFGRDRPLEEWRWRYVDAPVEQVQIDLLEADGRMVGHLAHVGFPTWLQGQRALCRQSADAMVARDWRHHGGYAALMGEIEYTRWDMVLFFPTEYTARQNDRNLRPQFTARVGQWVRAHDGPGRLLAAVADAVRPRLTVAAYEPDGEADRLAADSAAFAPCIRIRDARYLRWRWLEQPGTDWDLVGARDRGGDLRGVAAFGVDGRRDPPDVGRVVELLARDEAATIALLTHVSRHLRATGCRRVVLDLRDPRPWSRRACHRAGFARRGEGLLASGASNVERARPVADDLDAWYLTRGDTDLC